jgi:heme-degrading monooxygenase HmoA
MFAQITTAHVRLGRTDDFIRVLQDTLAPAMTEQQGFRGFTLLLDPRTDRALLLGLWAIEAALTAASASSSYLEQVTTLDELLDGPPLREAYEVCFHVQMMGDAVIIVLAQYSFIIPPVRAIGWLSYNSLAHDPKPR